MRAFALAMAAIGMGALCASPAAARKKVDIAPYIEVDQILTADVQNGDLLTYTTVAAGIDASVHSRRTEVQVSYRYEHRFAEKGNLTDSDVHSGLARADFHVTKSLSLEAGALATRARSDIRGAAPAILDGSGSNISQVYSLYAGPALATNLGVFGVSGSYRYGYTKVESSAPSVLDPSQPRLDTFDSSRNQIAQASINLKSGVLLPVGVTVSGGWQRDDAGQLSQHYDGKYARGDLVLPVSRTFALTGGAGYEKIDITQRDPLFDVNGQPVVDTRGRYVPDPASPLRHAYRFDGIYYDGGIIWRPSPRTQLEAHVGKRYGSISYTGTLTYQGAKGAAAAVNVYDGVTTFGSQLRNGVANLPTSFNSNAGALGPDYNGCVFGANGGAGGCLNGVFQSLSSAAFRARGVDAVASLSHGPTRFGIGAGYANRRFLAPSNGSGFSIDGVTDESYYLQLFAARSLDARTVLQGNVFANYYDSGIRASKGVYSVGGSVALGRQFGRLSTQATIGAYSYAQDGAQAVVAIDASLGARYQF